MHRCVRRCRGEPALTETYRAPAQTEALDRDRDARHRLLTFLSVAVFVGLVGWWGDETLADGRVLNLGAPPFYGAWRSHTSRVSRELWWPASAVVLATLVLVPTWWTHAVRRIRWGLVLVGSWAWALVWSVSLAATSGVERISEPLLDSRYEYLPLARELEDPGAFVSTFVEQLSSRPTHVRGHPPGAVLAFWGLDKVFATDLRLALAVIAIGALAAPASVVAVRALGDEAQARRVAVFAGLAPAAVWMATSADALFTGVIAISIAMGAVGWAATGRSAAWWSLGAGVLAGAALALSWGAPLLVGPLLVLWVVLLTQRRCGRSTTQVSGRAVHASTSCSRTSRPSPWPSAPRALARWRRYGTVGCGGWWAARSAECCWPTSRVSPRARSSGSGCRRCRGSWWRPRRSGVDASRRYGHWPRCCWQC
jgi:hypothetical protein